MQLIGQPSQRVMQQSNLSPGLSQFLSELQLSSFGTGPCCFQLLLKTPVLQPASHRHKIKCSALKKKKKHL